MRMTHGECMHASFDTSSPLSDNTRRTLQIHTNMALFKLLVLGSGMVARPCVEYLTRNDKNEVIVGECTTTKRSHDRFANYASLSHTGDRGEAGQWPISHDCYAS